MEFKVSQIAELLSADIEGNAEATITTVCKIEEGVEGGLSFLANPKYTHFIYETKATAIIVNKNFTPEAPISSTLIRVDNAYLAFAKLLDFYNQLKTPKKGISEHAYIAPSAQIGENVYIAEFVSIGDNAIIEDGANLYPHVCIGDHAHIGKNTTLHSGVKIYAECVIGNDCIIHAGSVIGADGFGFANQNDTYLKVPQIGNVVIEDNVEIGANTCIDRATMGSTIIHKNVKLDNLIQVAHNVEIGEATAAAAQVGIAGSAKIGKNCVFGGQVGINGHITIGDHVMVGAQSAIANSVNDKQTLLGTPAIAYREEQKLLVYRKKLPEIFQKLKDIEKQLKKEE